MLSSDRTGDFRDIEHGLVRSIKETQQPEKLVYIRERIGLWKCKFEEDHERKCNQVIKGKFEGVYTHLSNQLFVDGLSDCSGEERSDTGSSFDGCSSEMETLFVDGLSDSSGEERSDTGSSFDGSSSEMETLYGGSDGVKTIRMDKNKSILFPETENVAAPEPPSNAYGTIREGEGGEQEEANHVFSGTVGDLSCLSGGPL